MNLEKLDAAIAYIEAHPEEWNQKEWFYKRDGGCGTAACLAGTIVLQDGWQPAAWCAFYRGTATSSRATKDGVTGNVDEIAMEILGANRGRGDEMSDDEIVCEDLFHASNSLDRIKAIRDEIAAARTEEGEGPGSTSPEPGPTPECAGCADHPKPCPAHGEHPHNGMRCLDCPACTEARLAEVKRIAAERGALSTEDGAA